MRTFLDNEPVDDVSLVSNPTERLNLHPMNGVNETERAGLLMHWHGEFHNAITLNKTPFFNCIQQTYRKVSPLKAS